MRAEPGDSLEQMNEEPGVSEVVRDARRARLADACEQLDPEEERAMAEEGIGEDLSHWPEY